MYSNRAIVKFQVIQHVVRSVSISLVWLESLSTTYVTYLLLVLYLNNTIY